METKATHLQPLIAAVLKAKGNVVEFGCGDYSTPVLHELVRTYGGKLVSIDNNCEWANKFIDLNTDWHKILFVENWDDLIIPIFDRIGVLFIDHAPELRRIVDIELHRSKSDYIVFHDADDPAYNWQALRPFKYQYVHNRYARTTAIVSDFYPCEFWK